MVQRPGHFLIKHSPAVGLASLVLCLVYAALFALDSYVVGRNAALRHVVANIKPSCSRNVA